MFFLFYRNVETSLLNLIFHQTLVLFSCIVEHLAKDPFKRVVTHLSATRSVWIFHSLVTIVAHIEGCAIKMATVLCGIAVLAAQFFDIGFCTQHAGNNNLMQGNTLYL